MMRAFDLRPYQLSSRDFGGNQTYEIQAKVPIGTKPDQLRTMLRTLLIERFGLVYHFEKRESRVFELVVAKGGLKMKHSEAVVDGGGVAPDSRGPTVKDPIDAEGYPIISGEGTSITADGHARWVSKSAEISEIVALISGTLEAPVVDLTGVSGEYDLSLSWITADDVNRSGPTLEQSLLSQLGLRLIHKKGLIDVLVVDKLQTIPSQN
jgi:uncharacterized protein (TIGR03435 family)